MRFLHNTLLASALLHSVVLGQIFCYSRYLLTFYFCIPVPYIEKDIFFGVLVLEGLVGLHRTIQLQLLLRSNAGWGKELDYCDTEWFALETSRDQSVIFEIGLNYCILDSFGDYKGYSISSKGFLPTV